MLTLSSQPLTVGAITDEKTLSHSFGPEHADLIELRLDALGSGAQVLAFAKRHHATLPLLITARDPVEGGLNARSQKERLADLQALLPLASAVDVELANFAFYSDFLAEAKAGKVRVILSNHDFQGFDALATREKLSQAQALGADISKAAVTLNNASDFTRYQSLLADMGELPFSLMGMGSYGPVSRILAAQYGSRLNYGYLGELTTAPGQWPARLLKEALSATPAITSTAA